MIGVRRLCRGALSATNFIDNIIQYNIKLTNFSHKRDKMSDSRRDSDLSDASCAKKRKISNSGDSIRSSVNVQLKDFNPNKILNNNSQRKTICVQGEFRDKVGTALIILEKNAFREDDLNSTGYFCEENELKLLFQNDIYGNFECFPKPLINGIKTTIIYPATEKHIQKYSDEEYHLVAETPNLYQTITLPHIGEKQFNLQWVYNILDGKSEADRVVYDDKDDLEGFVFLPDLKWDGKTQETLYLLAIVRRKDIKSLRDLNETHLPLLKKIRDVGKKAISDQYGIVGSQLRIFFHYQPSFYHLHVHFTYLKHNAPGINAEKSHLLDTVINNIEMIGDYYKRATLCFSLKEMDSLFDKYQRKGLVQRIKPKELIENTINVPNDREIVGK